MLIFGIINSDNNYQFYMELEMSFQEQFNGYNKHEVDAYIERLKASYESKLMDERLKTLEAERRLLDLRNEHLELAHKEKSTLDAIDVLEKAKKFQEEGTKSFYSLVFDKLQLLVQELNIRFPNLRKNTEFSNILKEFTDVITDYKDKFIAENNITNPVNSPNDSMRLLLNKMQEYKKGQDSPKEVKISTNKTEFGLGQFGYNLNNSSSNLTEPQNSGNFYKRNSFVFRQKPQPQKEDVQLEPKTIESDLKLDTPPKQNNFQNYDAYKSESGFSFQEALNPKEDLAEIMKAFDFYNDSHNSNKNN